jgi:two-component system response regulator MtrA
LTHKVLVIEDDDGIRELVGNLLATAGYLVSYAPDGNAAIKKFKSDNPDLLLLDIMLPGQDGIEVCREVRTLSGVPIIMLTARSDTSDVVAGLEAGADDYIAKPFEGAELMARIRARLRPISAEGGTLRIGPLLLDSQAHEVRRGDTLIPLTPLEFSLLHTLASKPNQVFSRELLLQRVWGYQHTVDTRLVNVHVQRLRSKIEEDPVNPRIVTTVRGYGYKAGSD